MSQHAVKVNPELPSVVTAAFERYQMGCLHDELAGPDERKLQALDIILDICRVDTKAQEGREDTVSLSLFCFAGPAGAVISGGKYEKNDGSS